MLLDCGFEGPFIGTDDLADLLAVLEEQEGRHGADAELLGDVADLVNVDLEELGVGVLVGELDHFRRDHLARAAPRREAVEHDERRRVGGEDVGGVLCFAVGQRVSGGVVTLRWDREWDWK